MASLPTGTVTFLFADIEGSTRLLQQLGPHDADVLAGYRRLLRSVSQEKGGQEVDTQGDSFLIAFPRAKDAGVRFWTEDCANRQKGELTCEYC